MDRFTCHSKYWDQLLLICMVVFVMISDETKEYQRQWPNEHIWRKLKDASNFGTLQKLETWFEVLL